MTFFKALHLNVVCEQGQRTGGPITALDIAGREPRLIWEMDLNSKAVVAKLLEEKGAKKYIDL